MSIKGMSNHAEGCASNCFPPNITTRPKAQIAPAYSCPVMPMFHRLALYGMMNANVQNNKKIERLIVNGNPKGLAKA